MNKKFLLVPGVAALLLFPSWCSAAPPHHDGQQSHMSMHDTMHAASSEEDQQLASSLLDLFGFDLPPAGIADLRDKNLSYDEISLAHALAHLSGHSPQHILDMRFEQHMGWGRIAKEFGVKFSDAVHASNSALDQARIESRHEWLDSIFTADDDSRDNKHKMHGKTGTDPGVKENGPNKHKH